MININKKQTFNFIEMFLLIIFVICGATFDSEVYAQAGITGINTGAIDSAVRGGLASGKILGDVYNRDFYSNSVQSWYERVEEDRPRTTGTLGGKEENSFFGRDFGPPASPDEATTENPYQHGGNDERVVPKDGPDVAYNAFLQAPETLSRPGLALGAPAGTQYFARNLANSAASTSLEQLGNSIGRDIAVSLAMQNLREERLKNVPAYQKIEQEKCAQASQNGFSSVRACNEAMGNSANAGLLSGGALTGGFVPVVAGAVGGKSFKLKDGNTSPSTYVDPADVAEGLVPAPSSEASHTGEGAKPTDNPAIGAWRQYLNLSGITDNNYSLSEVIYGKRLTYLFSLAERSAANPEITIENGQTTQTSNSYQNEINGVDEAKKAFVSLFGDILYRVIPANGVDLKTAKNFKITAEKIPPTRDGVQANGLSIEKRAASVRALDALLADEFSVDATGKTIKGLVITQCEKANTFYEDLERESIENKKVVEFCSDPSPESRERRMYLNLAPDTLFLPVHCKALWKLADNYLHSLGTDGVKYDDKDRAKYSCDKLVKLGTETRKILMSGNLSLNSDKRFEGTKPEFMDFIDKFILIKGVQHAIDLRLFIENDISVILNASSSDQVSAKYLNDAFNLISSRFYKDVGSYSQQVKDFKMYLKNVVEWYEGETSQGMKSFRGFGVSASR